MKIRIFWALLCILGFGWCLRSCESVGSHSPISPIPAIRFKKFAFEDRWDTLDKAFVTKAIINFSFIDGDGDLGVRPIDKAVKVESSRVYYTWYKKLPDRTYDQFQFADSTITNSSAIPYSEVMNKDEALNKVLKGTMELELMPPWRIYLQGIDTMRVEFFITDRAKNESNVERTPDFSTAEMFEP